MGIGDWGLGIGDWGIGDWAQPPTPNPHTQYPNPLFNKIKNILIIYLFL